MLWHFLLLPLLAFSQAPSPASSGAPSPSQTPSAVRAQVSYTEEDVTSHTTEQSAWVIIDGGVYDVTKFLPRHPGGKTILLQACGKDSSDLFHGYHAPSVLKRVAANYRIGSIPALLEAAEKEL